MDLSLLKPDDPQGVVELVKRILGEVNTCIPGEIVFFDPQKQTATIKPCIRAVTISTDGKKQTITLPEILQCPVWFPFSSTTGFCLTYPVTKGDQTLILFSQRSFDKWLRFGGVQDPEEPGMPRCHSYNDAVALVGLIPNTKAIQQFQTDGVEIRNKERTNYVKVSDTQQTRQVSDKFSETIDFLGNQNVNITISANYTVPLFKVTGTHRTEGVIQTATAPGGEIHTGLTTNQVINEQTFHWVNGLLVKID